MSSELVLLGERIAEQAAHLDAAMHRVLTDLREFDTRGGWHTQGAVSCAHWLAWRVGWDLVTARERVRVARKLVDHPLIDDALRRGEVSYSKVRAMLRVATAANEPVLLEYARLSTAAQLETLTRKYALVQRHGEEHHPQNDMLRRYMHRRDTEDGMVKIVAVLHPEEAELVWAMLDHAAKRLTRDGKEPSVAPAAEHVPCDAECALSTIRAADRSASTVPTDPCATRSLPATAHHGIPGTADSAESLIADPDLRPVLAAAVHHGIPAPADSAESYVAEPDLRPVLAAAVHHGIPAPADAGESLVVEPVTRPVLAAPDHRDIPAPADSAESYVAEPAAHPVLAAADHHGIPAPADSAESYVAEPAARPVLAAAVHQCIPAPADSAESLVAEPELHPVLPAADHHGIPARADSAESLVAEPELRPVLAAADHQCIPGPADSAESLVIEPAPRSTLTNVHLRTRPADSAESRHRIDCRPQSGDASMPSLLSRPAVTSAGADSPLPSAETAQDAPRASGSGLLDRLLDEASAFESAQRAGAADSAPSCTMPAAASDNAAWHEVAQFDTAASSTSVLRKRAASTRRAFHRADALIWISQTYLRGEQLNRSPVDVMLTISASDLRGDTAEPTGVGRIGDSFVAKNTARRLSCDAGVIEMVEDDHGVPLHVARKRRAIAGALKRALLRRDATCTFPGCTHRTFLEGHHIHHWVDGGETSLENGLLLCSYHHRHVHEYGYSIEIGSAGRPQFRDPAGRPVPTAPDHGAHGELAWPWIREINAPLAIDAATIACEWDGTRPDFGAIVGHLAAIDCL